jgi:hypothetical protein
MVECQLPKLKVASSSLVARSNFPQQNRKQLSRLHSHELALRKRSKNASGLCDCRVHRGLSRCAFLAWFSLLILLVGLDVARGQQAAVRRESITVIIRRATKPDAEAVHAYTGFAVVLHADVERVA